MPELPEVETVRRRLEPVLVGRTLERVDIRDGRLVAPRHPREVADELEGERVKAVDRRGKYLVVRFDSGRSLLAHLRMTGTFRFGGNGSPADDPYARAVVSLDDGSDVVYRDVRRFGTWLLVEPTELDPYLGARLGTEPLGRRFTEKALAERLSRRRVPIKGALLDQRTIAGMGNIYADEALWYARVHPLTPAGSLDTADLRRLHRAVRKSLALGVARGGSSLRDYVAPDGSAGSMQQEFRVYGRAGQPCDRCGTTIEKLRVAGRGTSFCPRCQPAREVA
jgi:formamidopyrimidine-DNA glycosylase